MRIIAVILGLLFFVLQYDLWLGEGSLATVWRLQQDIVEQRKENEKIICRPYTKRKIMCPFRTLRKIRYC